MEASCREAVYGLTVHEVGAVRGTPHMHCWLHFNDAKSWRQIVARHPPTDVRAGRGTDAQAAVYLSKENAPTVYGAPSKQGKRNDVAEARDIPVETGSHAAGRQQREQLPGRQVRGAVLEVRRAAARLR